MPNQSLPDLAARTATADGDLVHVNSGGSDYKQTKQNFLRGNLAHQFANTSTLTSQLDTLASAIGFGTVHGDILSNGHQTETGMPVNSNGTVFARIFSSGQMSVSFFPNATSDEYVIYKQGTWGTWEKQPTRSEITALNNSFANRFVNLGSISATNLKTALIAAFDKLSVHDNPVIGTYSYSGAWMFWGHKYTGDLHGMMLAITYYPSSTSILLLNRSNGVDTVRAVNLSGEI